MLIRADDFGKPRILHGDISMIIGSFIPHNTFVFTNR